MIICVAGKSGSGKSTFSRLLAKELNYKYIDVDCIGHKIYESPRVMTEIYNLFGADINGENGKFNRKKLGEIIFSERDSERVKIFNSLTWKEMKKILNNEVVENSVIDWALLPKTEYWRKETLKIFIKSYDEKLRIKNLIKRDNITEEYLKLRDKASVECAESDCDFVFVNDYNFKSLQQNIRKIVDYIKLKV